MRGIQFKGICKSFQGKRALNSCNLTIKKGEIHCLLGENGAGKTTLMNILFGFYKADSGEVYIDDKQVDIANTQTAFVYGLGMVHQHFMLIDEMTVLQNIILGREIGRAKIDYKRNRENVEKVMNEYALTVDLDVLVKDLSVGMKQRVEILKVLYRGTDVLVLDEPTAVLTPQEAASLMTILKHLKSRGKTIIFITHKLNETMAIADRATVLRGGTVIDTVDIENTSQKELAFLMVGHRIPEMLARTQLSCDDVVLSVQNLSLYNAIDKTISFELKRGEIFGIAGVDGNGQEELEKMIMGLNKVHNGKITFLSEDITHLSVLDKKTLGIGHIPSDRHKWAMLSTMSLSENMLLGLQDSSAFNHFGLINYDALESFTSSHLNQYDVKYADTCQMINDLSGGNQQKIIVARELSQDKQFILAAQPGRGLDIGAVHFIYDRFIELRNKEKAILLISAELDEILEVADRIGVLYQGEFMAVGHVSEFTREEIGLLMAGKGKKNEKSAF